MAKYRSSRDFGFFKMAKLSQQLSHSSLTASLSQEPAKNTLLARPRGPSAPYAFAVLLSR